MFFFMEKDIDRYFQEDEDNQHQRRQMEGCRYPRTKYDGQMHDDYAFVRLEEEAVERHPLVFFVFNEINE